MDTTDVSDLLTRLLVDAGLASDAAREAIRVWAHSGVERIRFADETSVVFKFADAPFDREHHALRLAAAHGLPVPHVHTARTAPGMLGMLLDDLGEPVREADDQDGARAAVPLHRVGGMSLLPTISAAELAAMPSRIADALTRLGITTPAEQARHLATAATRRAEGTHLPPYGLCHSEYHPTSLHIGADGVHILDLARAFTGPGLLDLASWHGTVTKAEPDRLAAFIDAYVAAGGPPEAAATRGGLDAATWALGWHRVWVADWFTRQIDLGWAREAPEKWTAAISRHLNEATALLNP